MKENPLFYTVSMAKLCAGQGYFEASAMIYRRLLEEDPDREDLKTALAGVEETLASQTGPSEGKTEWLESLVREWVSLMVEHDIKQRFDKIRGSIRRG
ncbi:MAG: hypothetical protein SWH61_04650 [Thermodesulfobacteriota bacterium]|nr:hypothetical protein [Thermodesulfobacteriota bacterium]